jgi:hypothetical protein
VNKDQRHTLYRFYAEDGALLYIGITGSIPERFRSHDRDKPWYGDAARATFQHYPNRDAVLDAERKAIIAEQPRYNVQHNGGNPVKGDLIMTSSADRLMAVESHLTPNSLVGSYFHADAVRGWQGCIVAEVSSGVYLAEIFSWATGTSGGQRLVNLEDMADWQFYDSAEWMRRVSDNQGTPWDKEQTKKVNNSEC